MKPQIEKIETGCRKFLGSAQTVTETFLNVKDAGEIKVLTINARPYSVTGENLSGEAEYNGKLGIKAIVADADGNVSGLSYTADFGGTFKNAAVSPDVRLDFAPFVVDLSYKTDGGVYVRCVVETRFYSENRQCADVLGGCDGVECLMKNVETARLKASADTSFAVSDEIEVKHRIGKILMAQSDAVISSAESGDGLVKVKGCVYTCVTYQAGESDIRSVMAETPFDEELPAEGCSADCAVRAAVGGVNTRIRMEIAEEGENRTFTAEMTVSVSVRCFDTVSVDVVSDAFSVSDELEIVSETFTDCVPRDYFVVAGNAGGTAEKDGAPVDEILCVTNPAVNVVGCRTDDGVVTLEGVVSGTLIYLGEENVGSLDFEIPFVTDGDCSDGCVCEAACAAVTQMNARLIRGAVNIDAAVKIGVGCDSVCRFSAVREINAVGERQNCGCAIEVINVGAGMTEWDLRKLTGLGIDEIKACNPDLRLPSDGGQKAVVYRQIK